MSTLISVVGRCVNTKNVSVSRVHNQGPEGRMSRGRPGCEIRIHKTAEYILKNTCLVMGFVSMNGQYRKQVIRVGGVGALVSVLRCYSALCVQGHKGEVGSETIREQFRQENVPVQPRRGKRERRGRGRTPRHHHRQARCWGPRQLGSRGRQDRNLVRKRAASRAGAAAQGEGILRAGRRREYAQSVRSERGQQEPDRGVRGSWVSGVHT